jgi:hypothetical protein
VRACDDSVSSRDAFRANPGWLWQTLGARAHRRPLLNVDGMCVCASAGGEDGEGGEGGQGGQGGQAEVVQEHAQLQGVDVVQVKRELVNTWSNLVRALVATGRSADLDLAHATLQRQRNYLRSGDVQVCRRPSPPQF